MNYLELHFPVTAGSLPSDQGYFLFAAISRIIPEVHGSDWFAMETLPGIARGDGITQLGSRSHLKVRIPQDRVTVILKLAGQRLDVHGHSLRLGPPRLLLLNPAPCLYSRVVTIKGYLDPKQFSEALLRKLDAMGIPIVSRPEIGQRRAFRVGNHTIVGFSVLLSELSEDSSLKLQKHGIGGRRHVGAGFFVPVVARGATDGITASLGQVI
jgi:CRISPR-associated endonuclease/helicase Cas3